jgi:hypothetical protein
MFKIVADPTFTRAVPVQVPVDGGHRVETIKATFRAVRLSEQAALDLDKSEDTRVFLEAAIVKLDDLANEAGEPIPYSDSVRDQVLSLTYARVALITSYIEAVSKAKAGN